MPTPAAVTYRTLLRRPHVLRVFALAMIGRLGYATISLALLFTCSHATGSFADAALAVTMFGASGLVMPLQARMLDRRGQRVVLCGVAGVFVSAALVASAMGALAVHAPWPWVLVALTMGVSAPSLGPSMRAQWREITVEAERSVAYAMDAMVEEAVFLVGPLLVALALTFGPAWPVVAGASAAIGLGVVGLATSPYRPGVRSLRVERTYRGPLRHGRFRALLAVMLASGFVLSLTTTAVAALADTDGTPGAVGVVESAMGVASVIGGWWWGRASHLTRWPWPRQAGALLMLRVPVFLLAAVHPSLWWVGTLVAATGLVVAPMFVVGFTASDEESDPAVHTEASTWVTAAGNIGGSLGTSLAGVFAHDVGWAFGAAAAVTVVAAGLAVSATSASRR